MPELGYLIPVTVSPKLFPNNIQCDSRLASNTPLGSFLKKTGNKKWWEISQGQY